MTYQTAAAARLLQCCGPRFNSTVNHGNCTADQCLAWRWKAPAKGDPDERVTEGFCGLAGKP